MRRPAIYAILLLLSVLTTPSKSEAQIQVAADSSAVVILAYHRIGEDAYPDSNLRTDQFLAHIQAIEEGPYNVMSLPDIVSAFKNGDTLPPRTLAITFEGAYHSTLETAIPLLLKKNLPFTLFYAADQVDSKSPEYLDWSELKQLHNYKIVTLGVLPASYAHITNKSETESLRLINRARQRHREEFTEEVELFAYPFGEISSALQTDVKKQGFKAAFGLQSGVAYANSDLMALPRFSMTEGFGNLDRFKLIINAKPLPAMHIEPEDPYINTDVPLIGFSVDDALKPLMDKLSCFISDQPPPGLEILGTRVEIRPAEPFTENRIRVNCTLPDSESEERPAWRWFGILLHQRKESDPPMPQWGEPQPPLE